MFEILPFDDGSRNTCLNSIEVCTYQSPLDKTVTLANITHIVAGGHAVTAGMTPHRIASAEPMTDDEAMALVMDYAGKNKVPFIYSNIAPPSP